MLLLLLLLLLRILLFDYACTAALGNFITNHLLT
jgi:hypothetical protein